MLFEVLWDMGDTTREGTEIVLGGAEHALLAFSPAREKSAAPDASTTRDVGVAMNADAAMDGAGQLWWLRGASAAARDG
jgi:hypothetical protein